MGKKDIIGRIKVAQLMFEQLVCRPRTRTGKFHLVTTAEISFATVNGEMPGYYLSICKTAIFPITSNGMKGYWLSQLSWNDISPRRRCKHCASLYDMIVERLTLA